MAPAIHVKFYWQAIEKFIKVNQSTAEGEFNLLEGEWLMLWNSQVVCVKRVFIYERAKK